MQSHIPKLKIIFLLLPALVFSGCVQNTNLTKKNNVTSEKIATVQTADVSKKTIKILFVGDMMFDRYIREAVEKYGKGNYNYIFDEIKDKLSEYDLVVGNLEGPITNKSSVSVGTAMDEKKNLVFSFDPAVSEALWENNIKMVSLGNNHILNQSDDGLVETKKYLGESSVNYFGDTGGGQEFATKEVEGNILGFVNYNYSVAGSFEKAIEDIEILKKKSDIVIVCPHWGTEYKVGDPGQKIRAEAYQLIDAGADAIIGGHPHVIQSSEDYKGKKIYYSLGNFIFDQYFQKETMEGLGVEVLINPDLGMEFSEVKFEMNKRGQTGLK